MRYFLVFYIASLEGKDVTGSFSTQTAGEFINKGALISELQRKNGVCNIIFTNIIEVTESDYEDWLK